MGRRRCPRHGAVDVDGAGRLPLEGGPLARRRPGAPDAARHRRRAASVASSASTRSWSSPGSPRSTTRTRSCGGLRGSPRARSGGRATCGRRDREDQAAEAERTRWLQWKIADEGRRFDARGRAPVGAGRGGGSGARSARRPDPGHARGGVRPVRGQPAAPTRWSRCARRDSRTTRIRIGPRSWSMPTSTC